MTTQAEMKRLASLVVDEVGGRSVAARICEVSEVMVSNWLNPNELRYNIPAYQLFRLDAQTKTHLALNELARELGYRLTAEDHMQATPRSALKALGESVREYAEFNHAITEAITEGCSENKLRAVSEEAFKAINSIHNAVNVVSGVAA